MSPEQTNPGEAVAVLGGETTWPGGEEEADPIRRQQMESADLVTATTETGMRNEVAGTQWQGPWLSQTGSKR